MADQQFLASFGVDIDEGGVARLQQILSENRTLAQSLADSFSAASESIKAFKEEISTDLPSLFSGTGYGNVTENLFGQYGGLKIGLDMTEPKKEISSFTADAKKPIGLSANASGIVSAARTALEGSPRTVPGVEGSPRTVPGVEVTYLSSRTTGLKSRLPHSRQSCCLYRIHP